MPVAADSSKVSIDWTALGRVAIWYRAVLLNRMDARIIKTMPVAADSSKVSIDGSALEQVTMWCHTTCDAVATMPAA